MLKARTRVHLIGKSRASDFTVLKKKKKGLYREGGAGASLSSRFIEKVTNQSKLDMRPCLKKK